VVPRPRVHVRPATERDLPEMCTLWSQLRAGGIREVRALPALAARDVSAGLRTALADPWVRVMVAVMAADEIDLETASPAAPEDSPAEGKGASPDALDAEPAEHLVGMAVLAVDPLNALTDASAVHLQHMVVREGARRRGVGRALVSAAVAHAEEVGSEHVVVSVFPSLREVNRFYARLGFGPIVIRRMATVASLRRKLAPAGAVVAPPVMDVLAARRSQRARARVRVAFGARAGR
jgi:GNAT superfamily N-acetyltransferase